MVKIPEELDGSANENQENMSIDSDIDNENSEKEDSTGSEDDSSMSEGECERRRADCMENLAQLEHQFEILKNQLYRERVEQNERELNEIKCGRSQEYSAPLQRLIENMNSRKEVAEILKKYRMENIRNKFESEEQAAKQHYESEKQLAMDAINEELLDKIRRLEEDRHNVDLPWDEWGSRGARPSKVRGPGRKKVVTVSGPYIVYMLRDEEIMDDWTLIRKGLSQQREHFSNVQLIK